MSAELKILEFSKVCSRCKVEKPKSEFVNNAGKNQLGITSDCKVCRNTDRKKRRAEIRAKSVAKREAEEALLPPITERTCLKCNEVKSLEDFAIDRSGTYGRKSRCKTCCNSTYVDPRKGSNAGRPDKVLRKYGVSYDEVKTSHKEQLGLCANRACGKEISLEGPMSTTRAVIDHCHTTGKFRALLCADCNMTLGKVEKDTNKILGLIEYMEKYK